MRIAAAILGTQDTAACAASLAALAAQTRQPDGPAILVPEDDGPARNALMEATQADAVLLLQAGDRPFPPALDWLAAALANAGAALAYGQVIRAGAEPSLGTAEFWNPERLWFANNIEGPVLLARAAWQAAGGWAPAGDPARSDYDLWCAFIERGLAGVFVPRILGLTGRDDLTGRPPAL